MAEPDEVMAAPWEPETIPDQDSLFMRVHPQYVRDGELIPGVFRDQGSGMSTDWSKYATPAETRARAPKPDINGVLSLPVGGVRRIEGLSVVHTPDVQTANRAHTDVFGDKRAPRVRVLLGRLVTWPIPVPPVSNPTA